MHISETRWAYLYRVGDNPGDSGVGSFGVAPALFCVGSLSAGETQIWPGDFYGELACPEPLPALLPKAPARSKACMGQSWSTLRRRYLKPPSKVP